MIHDHAIYSLGASGVLFAFVGLKHGNINGFNFKFNFTGEDILGYLLLSGAHPVNHVAHLTGYVFGYMMALYP